MSPSFQTIPDASERSGGQLPYAPRAPRLPAAVRRLVHFWVVWTALLFVHEGGHAFSELRRGGKVERVTVGAGPALWRGDVGDTDLVLRLVPVVGLTTVRSSADGRGAQDWTAWRREAVTLLAGVAATLALAGLVAAIVAGSERLTGSRFRWGRIVVADAVVLTVFNFLPVPPLDGGRALLGAFAAWQGAPLEGDTLFWIQVGGLALAVVPMTLWTRWTSRIDDAALRWGAPRGVGGERVEPGPGGPHAGLRDRVLD